MPSSSPGRPARYARPTSRSCEPPGCPRRRSSRRLLCRPTSTTPTASPRGWASSRSPEPNLRPPAPPRYTDVRPTLAGVAELADAKVSKTFERKLVRVRPPPPAPFEINSSSILDSEGLTRHEATPERTFRTFQVESRSRPPSPGFSCRHSHKDA